MCKFFFYWRTLEKVVQLESKTVSCDKIAFARSCGVGSLIESSREGVGWGINNCRVTLVVQYNLPYLDSHVRSLASL